MEDLAEFFDPADVITKTAIYTPSGGNAVKLYGQFDNGFVNRFGVVEDLEPGFLCIASKVAGVLHGDAMTIDSVAYSVVGIEPDGTGLVTLRLQKT